MLLLHTEGKFIFCDKDATRKALNTSSGNQKTFMPAYMSAAEWSMIYPLVFYTLPAHIQ